MGFVGLPVSLFLYWLMLRSKKENPYPKGGLLRLVIAGGVSVVLSVILTIPLDGIMSFLHLGVLSDPSGWIQATQNGPEAITEYLQSASGTVQPTFFWNLISMFISAGLLEEGLKFLTCRIAIRKEGMVRTWMDSVTAFAIVGITFELLENIVFGMNSDLISAIVRSIGCAHFVFGVIMGWIYGKYLVTGQKKYRRLSLLVPIIYHTITNTLMGSMDLNKIFNILGQISGMSHIIATVVTVIIIIHWQKNKKLDVPVQQK